MQRYFIDKINNNLITLSKDDSYHITKVMRMNILDKIEIVYNKKVYIAEITNLQPDVVVKLVKEKEENTKLSRDVTIVQSLVKEQKMDYILQKTTELGVSMIIPFAASRSVVKIDGKESKKIERWQSIVKEASEQSKQIEIPKVENIIDISNLVKLSDYDVKFLCTVNEKSKNIKKVLSNLCESARMLFVIGPEGGFTKEEEQAMMDNDFIPISLGNSVLRTETASTFIMSVVRYIDMEWSIYG